IPLKRSLSTAVLPYEKIHVPVLLQEVLSALSPKEGGIYCDMTFGDGGYTQSLLDACHCKVVAIDQDPVAYTKALKLAEMEPYKNRLFPILGKFSTVKQEMQSKFPDWHIPCFDGMVMDIGVSSGQIQTPERGFSYKLDGPLDMRMSSRGTASHDKDGMTYEKESELLKKSITAYEIVNFFHQDHIADIIYQYGQDRLSRRIAAAIVEARQKAPIETTRQLATLIHKACPQPGWLRGEDDVVRNSAARTFQAFRIFINNELDELKKGLSAS
ncbi:methylase MraW, partial [Mycotypha africana]|uniref:methylase MraW n=1 Tax=Mycotypha africana TaxID=64632 RepID=UPI0023010B9D